MKYFLSTIMILLATLSCQAQEVTTFLYTNDYYSESDYIFEASDGNLIVHSSMFSYTSSIPDTGFNILKINLQGELLDTLFIPDDDMLLRLMDKNLEQANDNFLAKIAMNESDNRLIIYHFDDDLNLVETINEPFPVMDEINPLSYFHDPFNDIIVMWYNYSDHSYQFARFGLDGTLKTLGTPFAVTSSYNFCYQALSVYNKTPFQYACIFGNTSAKKLFVLDPQFNIVKEVSIAEPPFSHHTNVTYEYLSDQYSLRSSRFDKADYTYGGDVRSYLCLLEKIDKNDQIVNQFIFDETPAGYNDVYEASPFLFRSIAVVDSDNIYYALDSRYFDENQIYVVRLNGNFEIQWERRCFNFETFYMGHNVTVLSDGGLAVCGFNQYPNYNEVFVAILDNEGWTTPEMEQQVKPFGVSPNPCTTHFSLQLSPDVECSAVELYNSEGRLVSTQSDGFESISTQDLAEGIYLARIILTNGKTYTEKIIKQ